MEIQILLADAPLAGFNIMIILTMNKLSLPSHDII